MSGPDNSRYLVSAARQRHDQALSRAREVLRRLEHTGEPVTFRSVADAASVSRGWLYRVPELRAAIVALRSAHPSPRTRSVPAAQRASTESLQRRLEAVREEITRLRDENAELRDRLARLYGERRAGQFMRKRPEPDQLRG
jgi:hypothetical protein